jgi:2-methylisocitrate lyase-like PEP mutase family enzyme
MTTDLQEKAATFRRLHRQDDPIVLINAWDAASASVLQAAGANAIATTSAGMAWSLGYPDGQQVPVKELVDACARIARVVRVPLSVDVERGYARSVEGACDLVRALMALGVVGINIEDGLDPRTGALNAPDELARRIDALRAVAEQSGVALFINARTDVFVAHDVHEEARCDEALGRSRLYASAGADGLFVPGLASLAGISRLCEDCTLPLNVYAGGPGAPAVSEVARCGARRVSLGCGPAQALLAFLRRIADEALTGGRFDAMVDEQMPGELLNQLFNSPTERGNS